MAAFQDYDDFERQISAWYPDQKILRKTQGKQWKKELQENLESSRIRTALDNTQKSTDWRK